MCDNHVRAAVAFTASLWVAGFSSAALASTSQILDIDGVRVALELVDSDFSNGTAPLVAWIKRSLGIVAAYYGHFPASELRIRVLSLIHISEPTRLGMISY